MRTISVIVISNNNYEPLIFSRTFIIIIPIITYRNEFVSKITNGNFNNGNALIQSNFLHA